MWYYENEVKKAPKVDNIPAELLKVVGNHSIDLTHTSLQIFHVTRNWLDDWRKGIFLPLLKKGDLTKERRHNRVY